MPDTKQDSSHESPLSRRFAARYAKYLVAKPLVFVLLPLVLCLFACAGLLKLQSTPDSRVFFSEDNPQLKALQEMEETFSKNDNAFVAFAPSAGNIFTPEISRLILELTDASWQIPYSTRVDSLSSFQLIRSKNDDISVNDLIRPELLDEPGYHSEIESYVMNKPAMLNRKVSIDGRMTGVNVTVEKPENNPDAVFEIVSHVRQMVAEFEDRYPDVDFYLTGGTLYDAAFTEVPDADNRMLGPLMLLVIFVILGLSLRSIWFVAIAMMLIGLATGTMLGLTGWSGARMNAGTAGAPVIVLSLAVAYCVHVLVTIRQQIIAGLDKHAAIAESIRVNFSPVTITSLTTAIGFLTLNFSDAPPFRQLGNMVALGVVAILILSVTFLPAALCYVRVNIKPESGFMSELMAKLASFVVREKRMLLPVVGAMVILLSLGSTLIVLDDNFIKYFDERYRIRRDTDSIESRLTGMNALEYPFPAAVEGGVLEPSYLNKVVEFERWLVQQEKVTSTVSIVETLKDLNRSMNGDDESFHVVPESRELAAQLILLYELSLPFGMDLTHQIDITKSTSRVVALVRDASSADLRKLNKSAEAWLDENVEDRVVRGSGLSLIFAHISGRNINSMLFGSLFALFVISLVLLFALRSVKLGLLSLVPNLVPAAMALGYWGYTKSVAGLSVAIVVAITLGIVVDDTVHFLSKYLRARREMNLLPEEAVKFAFSTVGVALLITSIALMAGFIVLSLSGFRVTAEMGLLSAVTIGFALFADYFLLPPMLLFLEGRRSDID